MDSRVPFKKRPTSEIIDKEALLQIWSDTDLNPQRRDSNVSAPLVSAEGIKLQFDHVPVIHVAIITRCFLYLFKAEHSKIEIPEEHGIKTRNLIVLKAKSPVSFNKIDLQPKNGAIMVNIPEPDKYQKCKEARLQIARHKGSRPTAAIVIGNTLTCDRYCSILENVEILSGSMGAT